MENNLESNLKNMDNYSKVMSIDINERLHCPIVKQQIPARMCIGCSACIEDTTSGKLTTSCAL